MSLRIFLTAVYIMWYRQIKRFTRARSRVVGAVVQPILWMIFFGLGWAPALRAPSARVIFGGVDYLSFLAPGVAMMGVFMVSFMSGISVIWDREFGFLKEVLVAPVPREATIIGRALGDSTVAVAQGLTILAVAHLISSGLNSLGMPIAALSMLLVALAFSGVGIAIGSRMSSMEGFQLINTFISMPTLFLSGAFFPILTMPSWMKILAFINPLTYGVDAGRGALTGNGYFSPWFDLSLLLILATIFMGLAAWTFRRTTIE